MQKIAQFLPLLRVFKLVVSGSLVFTVEKSLTYNCRDCLGIANEPYGSLGVIMAHSGSLWLARGHFGSLWLARGNSAE